MTNKIAQFVYGFKLIATWMLIPFVLFFSLMLYNEFKIKVTTTEVTLMKQLYSAYPDEYLAFEADINGKTRGVHAPVTSKSGDKITVVLRDGSYYLTPKTPDDLKAYTTFSGRFLKVCNNNLGYHAVALAVVLLITFLLTIGKTKDIRKIYPKLSKSADIAGIICSVIMSLALLYAVLDNSLTSMGIAYLALYLGIVYTAVFSISWLIEFTVFSRAKNG